jgi:IS5 family transposase
VLFVGNYGYGPNAQAAERLINRIWPKVRARMESSERNALGRLRGGYSTKFNTRTNAEGLPIGLVITPGQDHDVTAFPALMQAVDCDPEQLLGDKGYDSDAVRQEIAVAKRSSRPSRTGKYSTPSTKPSTDCATASSGSSIA